MREQDRGGNIGGGVGIRRSGHGGGGGSGDGGGVGSCGDEEVVVVKGGEGKRTLRMASGNRFHEYPILGEP